jgi:hypothetical protein
VPKHSTKWSSQEIEDLRVLASQGFRPSVIAQQLGRTKSAVRGKAIASGIEMVGERSVAGVSLRTRMYNHLSSDLSCLALAVRGGLGATQD